MSESVQLSESELIVLQRILLVDLVLQRRNVVVSFAFMGISFVSTVICLVALCIAPSIELFGGFTGLLVVSITSVFFAFGLLVARLHFRIIHHQQAVIDQLQHTEEGE